MGNAASGQTNDGATASTISGTTAEIGRLP
jgi:hypothetical protein